MSKQPRHSEALDDWIAAALTSEGATSASVTALLEEVDAAMGAAKEAELRARQRAYDPAVPARDRIEPAGEMARAGFLHTRLEIALDRLKDRADDLRVAEENSRRLAVYEKTKTKRDELAEELKALYPNLAQKLSDLLARVEQSNCEVEQINLQLPKNEQPLLGAELIAREMDGWAKDAIEAPRLTSSVRLPTFARSNAAPWLWPRPRHEESTMLKELFDHQARMQAEAKAAAKKKAKQKPPAAEPDNEAEVEVKSTAAKSAAA